jgi:hypothetical protein
MTKLLTYKVTNLWKRASLLVLTRKNQEPMAKS